MTGSTGSGTATTTDPVRAEVEAALAAAVGSARAALLHPCRTTRTVGRTVSAAVSTALRLSSTAASFVVAGVTGATPSAVTPTAPPVAAPVRRRPPVAGGDSSSSPASSQALPIDDYDTLPTSNVIDRLARLSPGELGVVAEFERTNRGRRTVLGRIEQLLAAE